MKSKTLKVFIFSMIFITSLSSSFASPMNIGGEAGEIITLPFIEIVGEIKGNRPPGRSTGCNQESGCYHNNQASKDSLSPRVYLCIGASCQHFENVGTKQRSSIVRVQDGRVVEQVRVTITEELKEVVDNELKVFLIKETQGQSRSVAQKATKIREGSSLQEEAAQLGSLLENAKNQSTDGGEKNDLSQVASVSFDYGKTQDRYSKLISEKLLSFSKAKITCKTISSGFQMSIQKAPLDIAPIPPEGKGAREKLKNISQAILNLAFAPAAVGSLYNPIKEETKALLRQVGNASTKLAPELVPGVLNAVASLQVIAVLFESSPVGDGSDVVPKEVLPPPLDPGDEKANNLYNRAKKGDRSAKLEYLNGENEKSKMGIEKYGIKTKAGLIAYSKMHEAIKTLPEGLKVVRIREGVDPNKFAIIGRKMEGVVNNAVEHLEKFIEKVETYSPSQKAMDDFELFFEINRRIPNYEEQLNTLTYRENRLWIEKIISDGYTVLDMGNPGNVQELSPFYEIEKELLFKSGVANE